MAAVLPDFGGLGGFVTPFEDPDEPTIGRPGIFCPPGFENQSKIRPVRGAPIRPVRSDGDGSENSVDNFVFETAGGKSLGATELLYIENRTANMILHVKLEAVTADPAADDDKHFTLENGDSISTTLRVNKLSVLLDIDLEGTYNNGEHYSLIGWPEGHPRT